MAPLIFGSIAFLHNYTDSTSGWRVLLCGLSLFYERKTIKMGICLFITSLGRERIISGKKVVTYIFLYLFDQICNVLLVYIGVKRKIVFVLHSSCLS